MNTSQNQTFVQIAALFGHQMVTELQALYDMEQTAMDMEREGDEVFDIQVERINNGRDRYNSLSKMRTEVEFMAAGYNGTPCCDKCKDEPRTGPQKDPASFLDDIFTDMMKHGIGVQKINIADLFKDEPKNPVPPENKAQAAAQAAGDRAAQQTGG